MNARITELERLVAAFVRDIPDSEEYARRLETVKIVDELAVQATTIS